MPCLLCLVTASWAFMFYTHFLDTKAERQHKIKKVTLLVYVCALFFYWETHYFLITSERNQSIKVHIIHRYLVSSSCDIWPNFGLMLQEIKGQIHQNRTKMEKENLILSLVWSSLKLVMKSENSRIKCSNRSGVWI